MSHSNSSLNTFANCMKKYEHQYLLHTAPCKPPSPHLIFGVMAHEVMHKAGLLRDETEDEVVDTEAYYGVIPSEVLHPELKQEFQIESWGRYFNNVIKQTAIYEKQLIAELAKTGEPITVEREIKLQLTPEQLRQQGYIVKQPLVGIVDLLITTPSHAVIIDYKFSASRKSQDDFDMNSQFPVYALLVSENYKIPMRNIKYGYIDIPKQDFGRPTLLTNGTLSRAKSQKVSQELYEAAVKAIHGDDEKYNCKPGGFYYDAWCAFALNKAAYLSIQWADLGAVKGIVHDVLTAAEMVDKFSELNFPYLKKYDAYTCKSCEFVNSCKPWTQVN